MSARRASRARTTSALAGAWRVRPERCRWERRSEPSDLLRPRLKPRLGPARERASPCPLQREGRAASSLAHSAADAHSARVSVRRSDRATVRRPMPRRLRTAVPGAAHARRNAVRRYRSDDLDPAQLGRVLGVAYLVSGSVRRSGTRLRVTVELVRATTGVRLWGEQYDRAQANLLDLQEGIARAVAGVIAGRLLPAERASLAARPTRSPEAYDYFVRGNYYLAQRTARSTNRAVDQYRAALRLDPGFTRALARIAYAHAQTLYWGSFPEDVPADSILARGLAAADGALHQDSTSSDAWMARAFLLSYRYPRAPEQARDAIERAVALDPRNAEAHHQYGTFLTSHGEYAAAVGQYQQALTIDPQRGTTLTGLGMVSLRRRDYAAARDWLDSSLAVDPGFYPGYVRRAEARLLLGDTAAARSDAETAARLSAGDPLLGEAVLALVEARAGDPLSVQARVGRLLRDVAFLEQRVRGGAVLAMALVALGDHQEALDLLERLRPRGTWLWDQL